MQEAEPEKQQRVETRSSILRKPFSEPEKQQRVETRSSILRNPFSESEKQQRVETRSSVLRKPFSDLTNLIPKPHRHSTSSQLKKPKTSTDPAMSISSTGSTQIRSLLEHQFTAPRDQHPLSVPRTPSPVTLNVAPTQNADDSVRKGKPITYSESQTMMKTRSQTKATIVPVLSIHLEKTVTNMKGIPKPPRYPRMKTTIIMEPLFGMKFNDKRKAVVDSSLTDLSQKYEGKMVATPLNHGALKNKDEGSMSRPLLRRSNKKRSDSSKQSSKKFELPQDFIDQQRAYFKEIDDYQLEVEEAEEVLS